MAIASNAEMVVFGGTQTSGQAFWRLYYDALTQGWRWQTVSASGGGPSARFGHAAVYSSGKMYVFGGSDNSGGTPTDSQLWEFTFSTGLWSVHTVATGTGKRIPKPRRDHTMVLGSGNTLLLYSGYVGASASSDTLWKLNLDGTSEWTPISVSGTSPGSRLNHAAYFDDSLFIFGGDPNESDKHVYSINPFAASPTWHEEEGEAPYHLSGHSVAPDPAPMILHARKPEVYDPGTDAWVTQSNSGWLPVEVSDRGLYPVQFLVPGSSVANGGGRIVRVGPDAVSRYLDVPASGASQDDWTAVSSGNAGFRPLTGVMYEPGKILIAGGSSTGGSVVGTSKTLNALGSSGWENSSSQLLARINHNLVLLPNGKVLAIGGDGTGGAVICPQLWDPANPSVWSASSPCALEEDDIERTYHSTAILLPDGRVLTGGGQDEDYSSYLRVFCPPYLFKSDGVTLATRPQITEAPNIIAWGDTFTICTPYPSQISKVCLIRPAATTHSFDQNQRYVPLIFDKTSRSGQLIVTAPASPDSAPPGNYLLFIVGSSDGTDVPAVARWVNLGCPTCESVDPDPPDNFAVDIVSDAEAYLLWTASGDDGTVGTAAKDQLRYATSQITSSNWSSAALWRAKVPQCPESGEQDVVGNLTACTNYWFALKTRDGAGHWSGLSDVLYVQTMCGGGPGGGTRAREGDPSLQASRSANETLSILQGRDFGKTVATSGAVAQQATSLPATGGGGGAIAAELQPDGGALRWSVYYLPENEATALAGKDATELLIQEPDGTGGWQTLWRTAPSPASTRFGIRSAGNARRFVFLGSFGLEQAAARVAVDGHKIELEAADHSQLGDLTNSIKMDGDYRGGLAPGDTLGLSYRPAAESAGSPAGTFLVISRLGGSATSSSRQSPDRPQVPSMPASFALGQNQPNPFSRSTRIQFDLPVSSPVRLEVFDLLGRRVATLVDGDYPAGTHSVEWNLLDNRGETLRPGVYVCRMAAGQFRARRKLSLVP